MGSGSDILAEDFVLIQDDAQSLLGPGTGSKGYGQTVLSSDVYSSGQITAAQWTALKYDIINIRYHQDGVLPAIVSVNKGDVIGFGASSPNSNYRTLIDTAIANRFNVASSQSVVSSATSASTSNTWSQSASCVLTVTFSNPDEARYFFNSGGKVRIASSIAGGSSIQQVTAWKNLLSAAGTQSFGAAIGASVSYYTLTNSFQTYYQQSSSTPYSANNYKLEARTPFVSNNSLGTAQVLEIKITLTDNYTDPGPGPSFPPDDIVNGTLTVSVEELKAVGSLQPSGTFSITSPGYQLSSFTTS